MGTLLNRRTTEQRPLLSHTLVGRAPECALRLDERLVSGEHATITWHEDGWRVRDLGSRNGTFLDGERIEPRLTHRCAKGAKIAFGGLQHEWELVDDAAPRPMLVPLQGGPPCQMDRGILLAPSADQSTASIHQDLQGSWLLEQEERVETLEDGALVHVGGSAWRFHVPTFWVLTESFGVQPLALDTAELCFRVSLDEETVELDLRCPGRLIALGSRSAFYFLLTLARIRLERPPSQGWVHWSELAEMLHAGQVDINLWVHRVRQRFAEAGFARPGTIIERRGGTGQMRIGMDRISISRM